MFNSLRIKLTLWYSGVLALILIVFGLLFYFVVEQTVKQVADDSLEDTSDALITRLQNNPDLDAPTIDQTLRDFRLQYTVFAIYDRDKNLIAGSPRLFKETKLQFPAFNIAAGDIPKEVLNTGFEDAKSLATFLHENRTNVRIYTERTNLEGREFYIATLRPLTNQDELLTNIRLFLVAGIPFALLLSSIGGYYLAHKILQPIREMDDQTSFITSRNLSARLPIGKNKNELEHLAVTFNDMLERLENSFELRKRFMADASHELRTPLAIVRGEAEVALQQSGRTEEEYRESLDVIRQEGVRLSHIVEDLFLLARADSEEYKVTETTFYVDDLIRETARAARTLIAEQDLEFDFDSEDNLIFKGDESLIRRSIIILLGNAIKYTEKPGRISLTCSKDESHYQIEVFNTGTPIPEAEQSRIFERFYRADKARGRKAEYEFGSGAGLGLSIGTWIAKMHNGTLDLVFSNETGTKFAILLPQNQTPKQ